MPADGTQITAKDMALAAYRDISAGRKPSFDLDALPMDAVIAAALAHGKDLHDSGYLARSHDGLASSVERANQHRLRRED